MSLEMLGSYEIGDGDPSGGGFGAGDFIRAASELTARGVSAVQEKQAAEKASASDQANLQAAIAADASAATAMAQAMTSAAIAAKDKTKQDQADADAAAAQVALSAQQDAAAAVSPALASARIKAANAALADATKKLQAAPTNAYNQNLVKAWGKVLMMGQNAQFKGADKMAQQPPAPPPWPTWKKVALGTGIAGGLAGLGLAAWRWIF